MVFSDLTYLLFYELADGVYLTVGQGSRFTIERNS